MKRLKSKIQNIVFIDAFLIMFLNELACIGAGFIDGLVVGNNLGSTAIASVGIVYPLFTLVGVVSGMLMIGTQKNYIKHLGRGNKQKADEAFNTSVIAGAIFSILLTLILYIFRDSIVRLLGAKGNAENLFIESKDYLVGLIIGVPALLFVPILMPIVQVLGKKHYVLLSMISIFLFNVLFDLLAIKLNLGIFGIGLATSISQSIGLIILIIPLILDKNIKLIFSLFKKDELLKIALDGTPKLVKRLCNLIKPITINVIIISLSGSAAMSAMTIRNNLANLFDALGTGLGGAMALLSTLYVSERNLNPLKRLINKSLLFILCVIFPICLFVFIFAKWFALIYVSDIEVLNYAIVAIRTMAIDVLLFSILEVLINYWQGSGKTKEVNIIIVFQKFILPLLMVAILGYTFGVNGIWYALPTASFLTILLFGLIAFIKRHKEKSMYHLFPIPSSCCDSKDILEYAIYDSSNISNISKEIQDFCLDKNIDSKRSYFVALAFEELTTNIVEHGFPKDKKKNSIDVFLSIIDNDIIICVRDNCVKFNLIDKFKCFTYDPNKPEKLIGIRLIMGIAKDVKYVNTFGTNTVILSV